jgi:hypothetical protein
MSGGKMTAPEIQHIVDRVWCCAACHTDLQNCIDRPHLDSLGWVEWSGATAERGFMQWYCPVCGAFNRGDLYEYLQLE